MTDRITANLPSRDFQATETFYGRLGFTRIYRDESWMILSLGDEDTGIWVEFFLHPKLDPRESWFSACLRVRDLASLWQNWSLLGLAEDDVSFPRLGAMMARSGPVPPMFAMIDPDGSLWRVFKNEGGE